MIVMPLQDAVQFYVEQTERIVHEQNGWGGPGQLLTIGIIDDDTLGIYEVPMGLTSVDPTREIFSLAREMARGAPGTDVAVGMLLAERTVGFIVTYEKVLPVHRGGTTRNLIAQPGDPDSVRTRVVFGMDILGRVYYASRRKGEDPETHGILHKPRLVGALPNTLRMLNTLVAERMEHASVYLAALGELDVLADEDITGHLKAFNMLHHGDQEGS